ncbi:U32 family peptidase [Magnetofaba australis]|uniref:Ubiquinone biosynthesis protein UbiV n=1 Tax=Magnetofaba australis IT-1 TaxID=1434232 RepID=A0A1Y2K5Z1_9PROT|nr:U32 family peptidase [Magnetofaba australis]OSM02425.1 putative peptidase U32 [Magnetofaba australis IT-1]
MRLSIGPVLFDWGKKGFQDFYKRMAFDTPADILYIGEVVCSKRFNLSPDEMGKLAEELKASGKEIVFSTMGLVMSEAELDDMRRIVAIAADLGLKVEANDMAAYSVLDGAPSVAGPHVTTYNPETMDFIASVGSQRVVFPVELCFDDVRGIISGATQKPECELFAYGKLPLTFSARCYTSRAFNLPKSNCQYKCGEYPDGMVMRTQEAKPFLTINGIQTMSDRLFNVIEQADQLADGGIDIVRLSPQSQHMGEVAQVWRDRLDGKLGGAEALARLTELNGGQAFCNGYFLGRAGLDFVDAAMLQAEQLA